ncbi:hypothetical protein HGQ17_11510 [Nesterenkonia sp. MY13]|uniref:Uncharacterized protein n=1 Tax=Nesterenkonia sedimenti TaxID=1463632 RepID=A0A7X8TL58_9MICC|nr:hypothetical protein [Nesterenkonia sedimenti]NLS10605.1 hypothetical protein [Nesterenkonia sedimenti]
MGSSQRARINNLYGDAEQWFHENPDKTGRSGPLRSPEPEGWPKLILIGLVGLIFFGGLSWLFMDGLSNMFGLEAWWTVLIAIVFFVGALAAGGTVLVGLVMTLIWSPTSWVGV